MNDNNDWQCVSSKRNKNSNQKPNRNGNDDVRAFENNGRNRISSAYNLEANKVFKRDEVVEKKGDITVWMRVGVPFADVKNLILKRIKSLNMRKCGIVEKLWICIFNQLKYLFPKKLVHERWDTLREYYFDLNHDKTLYAIAKDLNIHFKFISLENCKEIQYGIHNSSCVNILHIGNDYFIPVEKSISSTTDPCTFNEEEEIIITNLHPPKTAPKKNDLQVKEQENLLEKLRQIVSGMEREQELQDIPSPKSHKRNYYDVCPIEQLEKDKTLKLCILELKGAHSGKARIIHPSDGDKHNINIMNRKNCGYNAFEGDTVYVKINDKESYTGKVMGVAESNHKPVNSLYICKVCKDQGSLMRPLDNSFPKIHVDNEPGRRLYENDLKVKVPSFFNNEQKSEDIRLRESTNYADNMYVSIFKMEKGVNPDRLHVFDARVERFDPEMCTDLFIVLYQYWSLSSMYPNGTVVGKLSVFDTFNDSLHLIVPICKVEPTVINNSYKQEIDVIRRQVKEMIDARYDVVPIGAMVFTVDNEETKDMDDALSYHVKEGLIVVGVHITDVTKYISPQHEIYRQAQRRFNTVYIPKREPIYLLEKELSTELLSLVPNVPRAVLSVLFYFKKTADREYGLAEIEFADTVIKSKYKLNYKFVENLIKSDTFDDVEEDLIISIKSCYDIARFLRRKRLPHSYFVQQADKDLPGFKFDDSFKAKLMIEEFMIMANEHVAKKIYQTFPNMSLLRTQECVSDYEKWVEKVFQNTNMNFASSLKQCCSLLKIGRISENKKELIMTRQYYNDFRMNILAYIEDNVANIDNLERARNMLQYDRYINDFCVYLMEWYKINYPDIYVCSIDGSVSNRHFSLDMDVYTDFTSPVRRFSDVIVHRLLKAALNIPVEIDTLDEHEVTAVCNIANKRQKYRKNFEKLCAPYDIFEETVSKNSFIIDCICGEMTNEELTLIHPTLERANSVKSLKFSHMSLDQAPVQLKINDSTDHCELKWKKIIFSYHPDNCVASSDNKFRIDNKLNDARLPDSATKLFSTIRRSYLSSVELEEKVMQLLSRFEVSKSSSRITSDSKSLADPIIDISLDLFVKNTLRVQFCSHKTNGLTRIAPELFIACDTLQLCMIHQQDPVMCFVPGGKLELKHSDIILKFINIDQYIDYFTPLIYVESLMEILAQKSEFTLIDLPIYWVGGKSKLTKKEEIFGIIRLDEKFCTSKNLIFSDEREAAIDRYEYVLSEGMDSVSGDLLCIRSKIPDRDTYWIGHGEVLNVCKVKDNISAETIKVVFFILTQYNLDIFYRKDDYLTWNYSVDIYLRSIVSKRQIEAVKSANTNEFIKQVILGNQLPQVVSESDDSMMEFIRTQLRKQRVQNPNRNQEKAIKMAMTEKLSLIWGPPGTGKTSIGCILAFSYSLRNIKEANNGVVLYCGPSNDCVNLVAIEMQRKFIDDCPKLLRIFGETQELADFPLPGFFRRNCKRLTGEMQKISLHFLIREFDDPLALSLRKFDSDFELIQRDPKAFEKSLRDQQTMNSVIDLHTIIHEMIKSYKARVKEAKLKLLEKEKYNMVLCTTSVSATRIMSNFTITQVIIDEAGMCKEPETLIPILSAAETVENVVLIGDHKQLRPIIHSNLAGKRGLQISMFERYQSLRPDLVTMLNFQYRMHPSICEFPSKYFYSGELKTAISNLWSGLGRDDMMHKNYSSNNRDGDAYKNWNGIDYKGVVVNHYKEILKQSNYSAIQNEEWPGQRRDRFVCFYPNFRNKYPERLVFIHIVGDETMQATSTTDGNEDSRANEGEIEAVGHIYKKLINRLQPSRLAASFITVLTQYKLQEDRLFKKCKEILEENRMKLDPIVKTVISSQGSENDYVILSTVRSIRNQEDIIENPSPSWERQYLGLITDRNQVNVALTRAKKGLIIIGNKNLLSVNKMWKKLITDLEDRGCLLYGVENFLN